MKQLLTATPYDRAVHLVRLRSRQGHLCERMSAMAQELADIDREHDALARAVRQDLDRTADPDAGLQVDYLDPDQPTVRKAFVIHRSGFGEKDATVRIRALVHALRGLAPKTHREPTVVRIDQGSIRLESAEAATDAPTDDDAPDIDDQADAEIDRIIAGFVLSASSF